MINNTYSSQQDVQFFLFGGADSINEVDTFGVVGIEVEEFGVESKPVSL